MSHDDNAEQQHPHQQIDHPITAITTEAPSFESSTAITVNDDILEPNQHFSFSDNIKSDILGLFDDEDDDEDDDYQDLNEDDDIELETFDWIDWDDILPDDDFDVNSSQAKRGRKKYQKFEKPSVLPSIRPKSPTKQATISTANSVNMLNNVQIPPTQPYQFPFPQIIAPQLFPQSNANKSFNQFPMVPSAIFPTYDIMFSRGVNLANTGGNASASSSSITLPPNQSSPPSPQTSSNASISSIFSPQTTISDEQMKELYNQIQTHTQLLFYNYFLSSFNQELKELNKKFNNLITSFSSARKESVNNKMRKLLYLFNVSKDVKTTNLLDGTKKALTDNSFTSNERNEERSVDDWIQLVNTSILDVEGIESMDIFLDFDYSFFYTNNQINWELFVKFLKPFKLFSNQSLLAEIQESIYYLNTTAERGIGSKRMVFTIPEDNLLLIGLKKHWKPGTTIKWEKIKDEFVPNKSPKQLRVRYKNMIGKRAATLDFNPFKTFRAIAEETNQQHEGNTTKKKDDNQDYSYLFEPIKLFKITSKLTRKELPVSYKDLSRIHTYVPRDNISDSESDDQTKESGEKKRKKNDKPNPKKKKKQDSEDLTLMETPNLLTSERIDQIQPQVEIPVIGNPIIEQHINPLNESSLSEVFLKPDLELSASKILPFEDVGSIDSSSEDEEEIVDHVEKDYEILLNGVSHKFTYEDDRHILMSLQGYGIKIGSNINGEDFDGFLHDIGKVLDRPKEVIRARYNKIITLNKANK